MSALLNRVLAHAYWLVTFVLVVGALLGCVHSLAASSVMVAARVLAVLIARRRLSA